MKDKKELILTDLTGKIALVTGATRGVGKGVALGLSEAGASVYITGRSILAKERVSLIPPNLMPQPSVLELEIAALGGSCEALHCDHTDDVQVEKVFQYILSKQRSLDILVNNAWGGYANMVEAGEFTWSYPFWKQPRWRWEAMLNTGVRSSYIASQLATPSMLAQGHGLLVNISFWAAQKYMGNTVYGIAKAAIDKMTHDMAHELQSHNIAVVSLYPGLVRTEAVLENAAYFDMSNSESPQFIGRVVAALAGDPQIMQKSGQVLVAAALAQEYDLRDIDGKIPHPITLAKA
jgi:NAD(P)-dependent dehydrogenase (short-subunit alcohol dehydrogenase family)